MNVPEVKSLLRNTRPERFKVKQSIRYKIENIHGVSINEVLSNLRGPNSLVEVETQPSRRKHDETYKLYFEISKRKRLIVVITNKSLKRQVFVVTAFHTTKKMDKLVKKLKAKRR
jgi:hypothetical protein